MRWAAIALLSTAVLGAAEFAGTKVQSVYLMPMASGLDQYLAHQLTKGGLLDVVTDAKHADAVFTDRLGDSFQAQLVKLYPEPKAVSPKAEPDEDKDDKKGDSRKDDSVPAVKGDVPSAPAARKTVDNMPLPVSTLGRGKGTLFLVDGKSHRVLWSAYVKSKNTTPDEMERTAGRIVGELTKQLAAK
jgi:hypothetical protein